MFHGLLWDVFGDFVLLAPKLCSLCIFARCIQRSATFSKVEDFAFCTQWVAAMGLFFCSASSSSAELYFGHLLFGLVPFFFLSVLCLLDCLL